VLYGNSREGENKKKKKKIYKIRASLRERAHHDGFNTTQKGHEWMQEEAMLVA